MLIICTAPSVLLFLLHHYSTVLYRVGCKTVAERLVTVNWILLVCTLYCWVGECLCHRDNWTLIKLNHKWWFKITAFAPLCGIHRGICCKAGMVNRVSFLCRLRYGARDKQSSRTTFRTDNWMCWRQIPFLSFDSIFFCLLTHYSVCVGLFFPYRFNDFISMKINVFRLSAHTKTTNPISMRNGFRATENERMSVCVRMWVLFIFRIIIC